MNKGSNCSYNKANVFFTFSLTLKTQHIFHAHFTMGATVRISFCCLKTGHCQVSGGERGLARCEKGLKKAHNSPVNHRQFWSPQLGCAWVGNRRILLLLYVHRRSLLFPCTLFRLLKAIHQKIVALCTFTITWHSHIWRHKEDLGLSWGFPWIWVQLKGTVAWDFFQSRSITWQKVTYDLNFFWSGTTICRDVDECVSLSTYVICAKMI